MRIIENAQIFCLMLFLYLPFGCFQSKEGCTNDLDCKNPYICQKRICVLKDEYNCEMDSDCLEGMICINYKCNPRICRCMEDSICKWNYECENCLCLPREKCKENQDCPVNKLCVLDLCERKNCQSDLECPVGMWCNGENCENIKCKTQAECPRGTKCIVAKGFCRN